MKNAARASVTVALVLALVGLPLLPDAAPGPMDVEETRVPLAFAAEGDDTWVAAPLEGDATVVGLTWDQDATPPDVAEIRVRVDGRWQDWEEVPVDDEHAPDPDSQEAEQARGGTAPIVVEGAEAVQFRATGDEAPEEAVAELIDVDDPDASRRVATRNPGAADAAPTAPLVRSRDAWNGDSCVDRDEEDINYVKRVKVMFVHHTAGHTSYGESDVPSIIRGICSYHVNSRGWDDIGYNALIDRYGRIWQGRQGDLQRGVQGAHTGGFNSWSHGVVLIGNHEVQSVTNASVDALEQYGAWYLDLHNIDPRARATIESAGSSKHPDGRLVTFDAVNGHRAASWTACPGDYCFSQMGSFMLAMDGIGGFKTYGGWPDQLSYDLVGGAWERPEIELWWDQPADWTLEIRDEDGRAVWSRSGSGSDATVTWDARVAGEPAPRGHYTTHVTATPAGGGAAATTAAHPFSLALPPGEFWDVSPGHTFFEDIGWLSQEGITRGCNPPGNTEFCPDDHVTREQMAAFINRAMDLPDATHAGFSDVPRSHPFAQDIANIRAAGITTGCGGGRFCPDGDVSREQMAAFMVRAAGLTAMSHPGFDDVPGSNIFREDIRRLASAGVTVGCNPPANDRYCPKHDVTRAQMSAFIRRADL